MKNFPLIVFLLSINYVLSQQIKGVVSYYQTNGKPASGVEIDAFGCNKTYSLDNGIFVLDCPSKSIGQPLRLIIGSNNNKGEQIELVNEAQLQYLFIPEDSNSSTIDLIVCYPGEKEKTALKYYNLVQNELLGSISKNIQTIVKSLDNSNLEKEERTKLTNELNRLRIERDQAQQLAEKLSEFISSLNLPKASALVQSAVKAIESGEGTEKALAIISEEALKKEEIDSKVRYFQSTVEILNAYFLRINLLLPKFKYQEVIKSYEQIIRIFETNNFRGDGLANLYTSVAHICFLNGQYDKSLDLLEKGLSLWMKEETFNNPRRARTMLNMGVYNNALGNTEKGLEFQLKAKEIIENSPQDSGKINVLGITYSQIGNTYIKLHNYEQGLENLQKGVQILEASTIQFDRTRVLGIAYDNLARGLKSVSSYNEALEAQLKSNKLLESVHTSPSPELATIYNNTANLLVELGRYDEAQKYSTKALEIRLATQSPGHPQIVHIYLTQANILFQLEEYDESLSIVKKAIKLLDANNENQLENLISAYQIYGFNLIKLKKFDQGLQEFSNGIDLRKKFSPEDRFSLMNDYTNLGVVYFELGDFDKAKSLYDIALKINLQEFPKEHANLGQLYWNLAQVYKKENLTKAYYYYNECDLIFKQIYPQSHPLQEKLKGLLIELEVMNGGELYKNGDYSNALVHFLFVVSEKPTFKIVSEGTTIPVYQVIGSCYYELKEYGKAIEAEKKALGVYPEYELDNYYNAIGLSYFKIYQFDEAKNAFEKYLNIAPDEWRSYRNMALYYAELKKVDLALDYLEKAIQFGFDDKKWLKSNKSFDHLKRNNKYKLLLKNIH